MKFLLLTINLILVSYLPVSAKNIARAGEIFARYCNNLSSQELQTGSYIENAINLYGKLLESGISTNKTRIVIILKKDYQKNSLNPDLNYLKFKPQEKWPYHSFVVYHNKVLDPCCNLSVQKASIENYFETLWQDDFKSGQLQVFAFQLKHISEFMGITRSKKPKLTRFKSVSLNYYLNHPMHISQKN
ncbi:MAG: hypothetical protein ACQETH_07295 [Candidatus Rifleibacteriota bacterium]